MSTINPNAVVMINGKALTRSMSADVISINLEDHASDVDMATITINNKDGQWVDSNYFDKGKYMDIHLGYGHNLKKMFSGTIVRPEMNFPDSGIPTLTIRAYDLSYLMRRNEQKLKSTWENITDSKLAETIAVKYGFKSHQLVIDDTKEIITYSAQGNKTDWAFLKERADRLGFELYVELDKFHFHRPYDYLQQRTRKYRYKENLKSFEPRLTIQDQITKVVVKGWDIKQKLPIIAFATSETTDDRPLLGNVSGSDFVKEDFGEGVKILFDKVPSSQKEAEELAKTYFKQKEYDLIEAQGSCIGTVELKAKSLINIEGIGRKYSGNYYVTRVNHTLDNSGYLCDFECKRNALSLSGHHFDKNKEALTNLGYGLR